MKRISIVGSPGSGKSTLAGELGRLLGIPFYHMDHVAHTPDGKPRSKAEAEALIRAIVAEERWVIEGHHYEDEDPRLTEADTIVFLNLPRYLCLWRYARRTVKYYGRSSPGNYITEKLDKDLLRGAKFVFRFPTATMPKIMRQIRAFEADKSICVLRSPSEVERFKSRLKAPAPPHEISFTG
ncbi:AAA family ATPase [Cohnella cellulosilytica]|uniref:AAA family ATPase n=1 Tax=Cohnella cellulosilytica TaxID=986710 RepID=A0ABW2FP27_9BACL